MANAKQFIGKSYKFLGLQKFLMVVGLIICLIGILSVALSGLPFIGGIFQVSSAVLFGILAVIILIIGVI